MLAFKANANRHQAIDLAENRTFSYQQIHAHKPLFGKQGKVLNLDHLYFDIVSDLELLISDFASLGIFTLVKNPLQISSFMQNKANFRKAKMNVNSIITMDYEIFLPLAGQKNKPNSNPIFITRGIINCIYEVGLIYCRKNETPRRCGAGINGNSQIFQRS